MISNTEYCCDIETKSEFVEKEALIKDSKDDGDDVRKILTDMQAFDYLLNEDIKAFDTSGSECGEDFDDFGDELQQLLSDNSTEFEHIEAHLQTNLNNLALELPDGENKKEEVDDNVVENVVRWKMEPNAEALEKLIDVKVVNVKDPYSNIVTVKNLKSGESSLT